MAISNITSTSNYYSQAVQSGPVTVDVAIAALKANPRLKVTISDTTANIAQYAESLSKLTNSVTSITQSDPSAVMNFSAAQLTKYTPLLAKFSSDYKLNISDAPTRMLDALGQNSHVSQYSITDTSANVNTALSQLVGVTKLTRITLTNPTVSLSMTATQMSDNSGVLNKINGTYNLSITNANCETAIGYASNLHVRSVTVSDTAANISSHLDDLTTLGLRLSKVTASDGNAVDVQASQLQTDALVIGKLYQGYQLSLHNASMSQIQPMLANKKIVSIDLTDTAANISKSVDLLAKLGSSLQSIHVLDPSNALQMTSTQFNAQAAQLAKIVSSDNYAVNVNKATVAEAGALKSNTHISGIAVVDNVLAISNAFDTLNQNAKISSLNISGSNTTLSLTATQLANDTQALSKLASNYRLNVSQVDADAAASLVAGNNRIGSIGVVGSASQLSQNVAALSALGTQLRSVTQNDVNPLQVTANQWTTNPAYFAKFIGGCSANLSEVSANALSALVRDSRVQGLSLLDSSSAINNQWSLLQSLGSQVQALAFSDNSPILKLTASQWQNTSTLLGKISGDYGLSIQAANVNQLSALFSDTHVQAIDVTDTASNIASQLDTIQNTIAPSNGSAPTATLAMHVIDPANPLVLSATQWQNDNDALSLIQGAYGAALTGVAPTDATTLAQNSKVLNLSVVGTAADLVSTLTSLNGLGSKIKSITQSDTQNNVNVSLTEWSTYQPLFSKFRSGLHVNVSQVPAAQAQALLADSRVSSVAVSDTAANLSASIHLLQSLGTALSGVTQTDAPPLVLSMQQYAQNAATLSKLSGDYALIINDASVSDAATVGADSHVQQINVVDEANAISAGLNVLSQIPTNNDSDHTDKLRSITYAHASNVISTTTAQRLTYESVLNKIAGGYKLAITDATASSVASLSSDAHVASMAVVDTASQISAHLSDLNAAGSKITSFSTGSDSGSFALNYTDWMQSQPVFSKFNTAVSATINQVPADKAVALASDVRIHAIHVSDSTAHINTNLDSLQQAINLIGSISPSETSPAAMNLTSAQYISDAPVLAKVTDGNYTLHVTNATLDQLDALNADAKVTQIQVREGTSAVSSHLAALANTTTLNQISLNDTAALQISASDYATYASTLAKISGNFTVVLRDALISDASNLNNDAHVTHYGITDTAAHIHDALATLLHASKITGVRVSSDDEAMPLTQTQFDNLTADDWSKLSGSYRLSISGAAVSDLSDNFANNNVATVGLLDSVANVSSNFDELVALGARLSSIAFTDASPPALALTSSQFGFASDTLAKISGNYSLAITDATANDAAQWANNSQISDVTIIDTASNLSAQFDALAAMVDKISFIRNTDQAPITLTQSQYDADLALFGVAGMDPTNYVIV